MKALILAILMSGSVLQAGLTFEQSTVEVQAAFDQKEATGEFPFSNTGRQPVKIVRYESSCACLSVTVKDDKRTYAPGEKGLIRAVFDLGNATGEVEKVVLLWLEDDPAAAPSIRLTAKLSIPTLIEIEPKTLRWEVDPDGSPEPQVITVRIHHDKPIEITSVGSGSEQFEVELVTRKKGRAYELKVTPQSLAAPALGVLYLHTDFEHPRFRTQRAFAVVRKSSSR